MNQNQQPIPTPPKANPYRGEASAEINGRIIIFKLTLGALADLCGALGVRNNVALFQRLSGDLVDIGNGQVAPSGPSMADVPAIVSALSAGALSEAEVRELGIGDLQALMNAIGQATARAFPEAPPEKKTAGADAVNVATTSPSTNGSESASASSDWGPTNSGD